MKRKNHLLTVIIIVLVIVSIYIDYKMITSDAPIWVKYIWFAG